MTRSLHLERVHFCIAPYEQFISSWPSPERSKMTRSEEKKQWLDRVEEGLELAKDRAKLFPKTLPFPKDRIVFWEKKSSRGQIKSETLIH